MPQSGWRSSKNFVILVVCVAVFTDVFLYGLIVPVMPFTLLRRVGIPDEDVQQWTSALLATYGIAIILGSLLFGWLGDKTETRQTPFIIGLLILGGGTLLFSLTKSLSLIVIARLLQGCSTAIVFTIGYSLMLDTVGNEGIGRAVGFTSMSMSLGLFGGPIIGGFVYDAAGYFAVFLPAFGLIALEITLRLLLRPVPRKTISLSEQPPRQNGEQSPLLPTESSQAESSLMVLLRSPRFVVAMIGMCMINTFLTAFEAVLPVYLHELFDFSSSQIAVVFLSNTLPMLLSPLSGRFVDKIGPFWPAIAGFSLAAPSMMLMCLVRKPTFLCTVLLRLFFFLFGCGVSMAMPAMMAEISMATDALENQRPGIFGAKGAYSQAFGLSNAAFSVGTLLGPLYAGYIREWVGWTTMLMSLGGLSILMVLLVVMFTGHRNVSDEEFS
ncbi:hypothetical protein N7493_004503 [Penicillium malachiteum]|uniref:Major facilitator superfamily (MFS) profile domain-containing protein n=1 Tax=Penicillium malachiteum TaxID=1324776 RepID=A0AAD6MX30_9EURO|nr:hypothetical protein N7493_004503 [Penicillium malachiteum]